jgi:hypothetical protein
MDSAVRSSNPEINMSAITTYSSKDNNWADESTTYWFNINGADYKSGIEFNANTFGIRESGAESLVVDCDGAPVDYNDNTARTVSRLCVVTDEMRAA